MRLSQPRSQPGSNETDGSADLRKWLKEQNIFATTLVTKLKTKGIETTQQTVHRWMWGDSRPTEIVMGAMLKITGIAPMRWKTAVERKILTGGA